MVSEKLEYSYLLRAFGCNAFINLEKAACCGELQIFECINLVDACELVRLLKVIRNPIL
jgi:hypothetical protein